MTGRHVVVLVLTACVACVAAPPEEPESDVAPAPRFEPPVVTNAASPVSYPPALFEEGVEGTVILRLFADENGRILAESTQIAEGSGYLEFDSAALAGVERMVLVPARRNGQPVATSFLQPVHFRQPEPTTDGVRP